MLLYQNLSSQLTEELFRRSMIHPYSGTEGTPRVHCAASHTVRLADGVGGTIKQCTAASAHVVTRDGHRTHPPSPATARRDAIDRRVTVEFTWLAAAALPR